MLQSVQSIDKGFRTIMALALAIALSACDNPSGTVTAVAVGPTGRAPLDVDAAAGAALDAASSDAPDGAADSPVDTAPDTAPDIAADAGSDSADAAVDTVPDIAPDIAPDTAIDTAPDTVPDVIAPSDPLQPCDSNADCLGAAKVCDLQIHACVVCKAVADCKAGEHCSAHLCTAGPGCTSDVSCKTTQQVCDKVSGACVDCNSNADCGTNQLCVQQLCKSAAPCKSSKECPAVCDTAKGICQECLSAADCAVGLTCSAGSCLAPVCLQPSCVGAKAFACLGGSYAPGKLCQDGISCTADSCAGGSCSFVASAASCDDGNPCTSDSCGASGCVHSATGGPCDDGDLCTAGDSCLAGKCSPGKQKDCDDKNPCTSDSCAGGSCSSAANSVACDDTNACTAGDKCAQGKCSGAAAVNCDDKDPCTADACNPQTGKCSSTDICGIKTVPLPYSEAMVCGGLPSGWSADAKASGSQAVWAVDASPSVPAAKSPGCSLNFNDGTGLACSANVYSTATLPRLDASQAPADQPVVVRFWLAGTWGPMFKTGLALWTSLDGKDWKVTATYDPPKSGWSQVATAVPNVAGGKFFARFSFFVSDCQAVQGSGPFIDDVEVLTIPCKQAACADGNPCTKDECDLISAKCSHTTDWGATCSDGNPCTAGDFCFDSACLAGIGGSCDDGNACTKDSCDPATGKCSAAAGSCDDGNSCTVDSCDAASGACKSAPSAGSCSDGNACTTGDSCAAGTCKAGAAKSCSDGNPCTSDSCVVVDGSCANLAASGSCDDGSACSIADTCQLGACTAGLAKVCNDGDACTSDSCDPATGACKYSPSSLCGAAAAALPYAQSFPCSGAAGWTTTGTVNGPSWAIDASPAYGAFKGYHSSACSANFNDGWDYNCPTSPKVTEVQGELTSPVFDGTSATAQKPLWVSAWMSGEFTAGSAVYLESTTDGAVWSVLRTYDDYDLPAESWRQFVEPLPALAGSKFKLRWRFVSQGCYGNTAKGAFVDDVKVYAAAPCEQDDPYSTALFDPPYFPGFSTYSPPYVLDPPIYAGGLLGSSKSASWHVNGSSANEVTVHVEFTGGSGSSVCVRHICDGSGPACGVICPSGTAPTTDKTGCCMTKVASGTINFKPTGTAYGDGTTTVKVTPVAATCEKVSVKAVF